MSSRYREKAPDELAVCPGELKELGVRSVDGQPDALPGGLVEQDGVDASNNPLVGGRGGLVVLDGVRRVQVRL